MKHIFQRLLSFLWLLYNSYSFYRNPGAYLLTTLLAALLPFMTYLVAGVFGVVILFSILLFLLLRWIFTSDSKSQ